MLRRDRTSWEIGRLLATIQINSIRKDKILPVDLIRLPWIDGEQDNSKEGREKALQKAIPVLNEMINKIK